MKRKIIIGSLLCLIASMSWGAMFPVAHIALQKIDAFYFSFIRYFGVSIILTVALWYKEGKTAFRLEGNGKALLFYGVMAFTIYNMFIFHGQYLMGETGTIAASIAEAMMPIITVMVLWVTHRTRPPRFTITSIGIALIGALLVITKGSWSFFATFGQNVVALILLGIAVLGWVIYSMGSSRFKEWSVLRYSTLTCLLGNAAAFVVVGTASAFQALPVPTINTLFSVKYEMLFMILLPGLVALLAWNSGMKTLTPINGILFINSVPITTLAIMAIQGYEISMYEITGTALVIYALVRNNIHQRRQDHVINNKPAPDFEMKKKVKNSPVIDA